MNKTLLQLNRSRILISIIVSLLVVISIGYYWQYSNKHPSTDDAYIGANVVQIAPEVNGPISVLHISNYAQVKKNQPLLDIDPALFQVAVNHAQARLELAQQKMQSLKSTVAAMTSNVVQRQSELKLVEQTNRRVNALVKRGQLSLAEGDKATRDLNVAKAALAAAEDNLAKAEAELGDGDAKQNADVRSAEAELAKAQLDLAHTHLVAPVDGYVANLTVRQGAMLQAGVSYFALVDANQWWAEANFKETDLKYIQKGQPATVTVDIYPGHTFQGVVESISRGSGTAFSIFPPENATGNWVKVTQRFPVRILILNPSHAYPLRIGASSVVTIDTTRLMAAYAK